MIQRSAKQASRKFSRKVIASFILMLAILLSAYGLGLFGSAPHSPGGDTGNESVVESKSVPVNPERHETLGSDKVEQLQEKRYGRRLRTQKERQKLIAAIQLARQARELKRRIRPEGDEELTEEEKVERQKFKEAIREAVDVIIEDVKDCYDIALEATPDLGGELVVQFEYEGEPGVGGVVQTAKVMDNSAAVLLEDTALTTCVIDTLHLLELPEPEAGGNTIVTYPFVLTPGSED